LRKSKKVETWMAKKKILRALAKFRRKVVFADGIAHAYQSRIPQGKFLS
jgi:hypothetical protein